MATAAALLEQAMGDPGAALVLADWLEERGEERRARLLRRLADEEEAAGEDAVWLAPELAGIPALQAGPALMPWLVADLAEPDDALPAGSAWRGTLWQRGFAVPTTMRLVSRTRHRVSGVLEEDFSRMYPGMALRGTFHFAGVALGRATSFVVTRVEGHGMEGGLYGLRPAGSWLSGTWWVPSTLVLRGELRLRRIVEDGT